MNRKAILPSALGLLLLATTGVHASEQDKTPEAPEAAKQELELWEDPTFQKQFMGSYGFQAEIEPRVTTVEHQQMEKILPLLSTDTDAAIAQLKKAAKPEASAVFDFTLGNVYFQEGQLDEAATHYQTALEKFPTFRRAHKNLGLIHIRQGRFKEAVVALSRVIELGGGDGLTYGLLGYGYSSTEQYVSAESAYRNAMLLEPETLDWKLGLTQSVLRQQKYGEAVTLCEELINQFPDRADFWMLQANAYIGMNKSLAAAENYEIIHRMGKGNARTMFTLGDIYVNEGLLDLATRAYGGALEREPGQDPAQAMRRVEALAQRGALNEAKTLLAVLDRTAGSRLDDEDKKKLLKLEARIAVAEDKGGDAVTVLEEIVALDPLDGEALMLLGQHYTRIDEPERAIFYYERAENIEKFEADARVRHAQVLVAMAKYAEALPLLKRAQEIEPRDDVASYLEQVERIARSSR